MQFHSYLTSILHYCWTQGAAEANEVKEATFIDCNIIITNWQCTKWSVRLHLSRARAVIMSCTLLPCNFALVDFGDSENCFV